MAKRNKGEKIVRRPLNELTMLATDSVYSKLVQFGTAGVRKNPKRREAFNEMMNYYGAFMDKFNAFIRSENESDMAVPSEGDGQAASAAGG